MHSRFFTSLLAGASLSSLCAAQLPQTMSISTDQPTYRIGQIATVDFDGTGGRFGVVGVSETPNVTLFPGVGTFCFDPASPSTFILGLGIFPPAGTITVCDPIPCSQAFIGRNFYVQAVELELPSRKIVGISDCRAVEIVDGDCEGVCRGGVVVIGLQSEFTDVTSDTVAIALSATGSGGALIGSLDVSWDFDNPPSLPISNANGSVILTKVERVGTTVTVRYQVDAIPSGRIDLPPDTKFSAAIDADLHQEIIHVSCSQPIDVGSVFGSFVVTKLIDKN